MSNWPIPQEAIVETVGADTSTSKGTVLSTSYAELVAATVRDWSGFILYLSGSNQSAIANVAIGASGSEQVIVESFHLPSRRANTLSPHYIPIAIPAGSRIACLGNLFAGDAAISGFSGGFNDLQGFSFGTSHSSVSVDPGAVAHTKGAWVEIVASTTVEYKAVMLVLDNLADGTRAVTQALADLAIGASGSEQTIIDNFRVTSESGADLVEPGAYTFPIFIPAGSRIAVRAQSDSSVSGDREFGLGLVGFS